jgi:hypothetical protein
VYSFNEINNLDDFVSLLNSFRLDSESKTEPLIDLQTIVKYGHFKNDSKNYHSFSITKKSGKERFIDAPKKDLKLIQRKINILLQNIYQVNKHAYGFIPGKSIFNNANIHCGSNYVYNIDLKDFFFSIRSNRIEGRLKHPPFDLNSGEKPLIAKYIANICTKNIEYKIDDNDTLLNKRVLPQGSPASPVLSNIICQGLDFYLGRIAHKFGVKYSRYADDITFSSMHNVYQKNSPFHKEVLNTINNQGFIVNPNKVRLQKRGHRQEVTGLLVNIKPNVQKRYIKQIRHWLYFWEKYGYVKAYGLFYHNYKGDKGNVKLGTPNFENVLQGKLNFLKMIKGENNTTYKKLFERFIKLQGNMPKTTSKISKLSDKLRVKIESININKEGIKLNHEITIREGQLLPYSKLISNGDDITPVDTSESLRMFSSDPILNLTTHSYSTLSSDQKIVFPNELFDLHIFLQELQQRFSKLRLPKQTKSKIWKFLFGQFKDGDGWSEHNITIGWNSPELHEWCNDNYGKWPATKIGDYVPGFVFNNMKTFTPPIKHELPTWHAGNFKEILNRFKSEIEFSKNNPINIFLKDLCFNYENKLQFEFEGNDNTIICTDVEKVRQALTKILDEAVNELAKSINNNRIKFLLEDTSNKTFTLTFKHIGSRIEKPISSFIKKHIINNGGDFYKGLIDNLSSICDLKIVANFSDGRFEVNVLPGSEVPKILPKLEVESVEFHLIFYKS